jgi:hypothetical protein
MRKLQEFEKQIMEEKVKAIMGMQLSSGTNDDVWKWE